MAGEDTGHVDHDGWGAGPYTRALVLVFLLALPVAGLLLRAGIGDGRTTDTSGHQGLEVPLLSARRFGPSLARSAGALLLDEQLDAVMAATPAASCLAVQPGGTGPVRSRGTTDAVVPASVVKLVVTYTALQTFGPDHRFTTRVTAGRMAPDGTVDDLHLIGGGDPFLATEGWVDFADLPPALASFTSLEALADQVVRAGVTRVEGSVVGDSSHFAHDIDETGPYENPGPVPALIVDEGFARWPTEPGALPTRAEPADGVTRQAAAVFAQLLADRGVSIAGPAGTGAADGIGAADRIGAADTAIELASIDSAPLEQIVTTINTFSSNLGAQMLFRHIGLARQEVGSNHEAARAVVAHLSQRGHPTDGVTLVDGIGLSDENRVTCGLILSILTEAGPDSILADSLAIAGVRGTARTRFPNAELRGLIRVKTGTLSNSRAIAGFARSWVDGTETPFVFIVNADDLSYDEFDPWSRAVQDDLLVTLVQFPCVVGRGDLDAVLEPVRGRPAGLTDPPGINPGGEPRTGPGAEPPGEPSPGQGDEVARWAAAPETPSGGPPDPSDPSDPSDPTEELLIDRWSVDPGEAGCDDGQRIHDVDLRGYLVEIRYSPSCDAMWARATYFAVESGAPRLHLVGYSCAEADTACRQVAQSTALRSDMGCANTVDESGTCVLPAADQVWTHMLPAGLVNLRACVSLTPPLAAGPASLDPTTVDPAPLYLDACTPPAFEFTPTADGPGRQLARTRSACRRPDPTDLLPPTG